MPQKQKNSKQGRNKKSGQNAMYINENRHEKSHIRRIKKHLTHFGNGDKVAVEALRLYQIKAGIISARP
jgi:hypothetical protein